MCVTVAIADDHRIVLENLALLLERSGPYEVVGTAETGPDTVDMLSRLNPDVAIVSLLMPELDGVEVTRRVRRHGLTTKILILTTVSAEEMVHAALSAGVDGYLTKDASSAELLEALQTIRSGHRYLSASIRDGILDRQIKSLLLSDDQAQVDPLSARERQIFLLVVDGLTSAEIGKQLGLAPSTVDTYRSRLMRKLDVQSVAELVRLAIRSGIITP